MKTRAEEAFEIALRRIEECRRNGKTRLDLSNIGLTQLPVEIGQLAQLTSLLLSNNQLTALPREIGQLVQLTELHLFNNQLTALSREIGQLVRLKSLHLSNNQLTTLPGGFGQLVQLRWLGLAYNQLTALPVEFGQLVQLTELDIAFNQLTALPVEFGQLVQLKFLGFSGNQLTALPVEFGQLVQLTSLYLAYNQLTALPVEFGQLVRLKSLHLSNNQLITLPGEFGQTRNLVELDLQHNRLSSLPLSLGLCRNLRKLRVGGNPLPSEFMKLSGGKNGVGTKLIKFLRAQVAAKSTGQAGMEKQFDEAKLLLVGPGDVGKTWLLKALQGHVPRKTESTKGIEIAREPLDLPHPTGARRKLHLTCWDFGGQEHYQITHQIFFSPKAIYLLVWKPREGFDPEMETRLERIQLSAGRTAKVLIVSTHADGNVPARLGQEALRERFGDLIGGFYSIDSLKGPKGTGIAALKMEIAKAAAQLEDMDLVYPANWHDACQAIRQINDPATSFKKLAEVCDKHGLDEDTADTLARLLEVQGHAVYFPDAAADEDAGALAGDNVVVLNPEWLAKAVVFVVEDKLTNDEQGILKHDRLKEIWKKDTQRDCPGYQVTHHRFLLWLMWKFDIAYKQNEFTSLVPELIARNRPDKLRWKPDTPSQTPEVRAVCVFASGQSGKDISPPKGLMPALTAAVHPLRSARDPGDADQLDRNWNNGFFLHTQSRGDAFVELIDRELRLVVRDEYPALLLQQVLNTLDELTPVRWPQVRLELSIPCPGKKDGKPCPGIHDKLWLEKQRGKLVSCQKCRRDDFEASHLLEGFDPKMEEMMTRLQEIKGELAQLQQGQRGLLAAAYSIFQALDPANDERKRGPNLFTILPEKAGWLKGMAHDHVRLTCWCEHPDGPHPGMPIGSDQSPDYVLKIPKDWLVRAAPYITWTVSLLKAFVPLIGDATAQTAAAFSGLDLKDAVQLMKDSASALPSGKLEIGDTRDFELEAGHQMRDSYKLSNRPELLALQHIHDMLEEQVKKKDRWGNLRAVRSKSGDILWLCPEHAAIQEPPPPQI
ncbi:leucine-rich repeat domain-containing protein [Zavarzinella formosa]|uniref:leucine-rich repeat domain-containing protein n=1 Tax=Zavarzinella formosa TaxID=360055 RepID=UPI0002F75FC0|nr:leucine-rich repeat domain-containing protein [Zavarzinella formosa]